MKKMISVVLAMFMVLSTVHAQADTKQVIRVSGLGIMSADENGDFRGDDSVTRAEMATIAVRLKGIDDDMITPTETGFSDVPSSHWSSGAVSYALALGLVQGNGDGTFGPDEAVTFDQVLKILVCVAGYEPAALQLGGYPVGYSMQAAALGLVRDVDISKETVTRMDIAKLVDRVLDVVPMESTVNGQYQKNQDGETLYEILSDKKDTVRVKGILTETEFSSLVSDLPTVKEGYIKVGDSVYRAQQDYSMYLGYQVDGYACLNEKTDDYDIITLRPMQGKNEVYRVEAKDADAESNRLSWYTDGKKEWVNLNSNTKYLYNGRLCTDGEWQTGYGTYEAIDNNGDSVAEVVRIQAAESFIVDRVNLDTNTIYFMNEKLYRGSGSFKIDDDLEVQVQLANTQGEPIALKDLEKGNSITLLVSKDKKSIKIVVGNETVQGKVESILEDDKVVIGGKEYTIAIQADGTPTETFDLGDEAVYVLDMFHNVIGPSGAKLTNLTYGYIVEAGSQGSLSGDKAVRIVRGLEPEKEVKTTGGNETISYYFQNDEIKMFQLASKVRWNETSVSASSIANDALEGKIVGYSLNGAGEIRELYTYDIPTLKSYAFNAKLKSFGGESVERGFYTDETTVFVCMPKAADEDEDYAVRLKLTDGSTGNKVYGVRTFPAPVAGNLTEQQRQERIDAQAVNVLVIEGEMDASQPQTIAEDANICMVGEIIKATGTIGNDKDCPIYRLKLIDDKKVVEEVTKGDGTAYTTAGKLRKGDLIRYTKDGFGRIVNIEKIASIQGLEEYGEVATSTGVGYYGIAEDVALDIFDYKSNQKVDMVTMAFDGKMESKILRVFLEEGQPVYMYERSTGWVYPATSELVESLGQAGSKATKLYAQTKSNDVTALVIIKD